MQATREVRRGRPQAWDREAVLLAARAVAVRRGYDGLRFTDVAEATGVPVSSLQYAFGTRDDLVREVLRAGVEAELVGITQAMSSVADPWERLQVFIRRGISTDDAGRREAWLMWIEYWRASLRDEIVREHYEQVSVGWRGLVNQAIDDGVSVGRFTIELSSTELSPVVIAIVDGLGLQLEVMDTGLPARGAIDIATASVSALLGVAGNAKGAD